MMKIQHLQPSCVVKMPSCVVKAVMRGLSPVHSFHDYEHGPAQSSSTASFRGSAHTTMVSYLSLSLSCWFSSQDELLTDAMWGLCGFFGRKTTDV
jgi:hypothetical protein